jgi:hypothetical protein
MNSITVSIIIRMLLSVIVCAIMLLQLKICNDKRRGEALAWLFSLICGVLFCLLYLFDYFVLGKIDSQLFNWLSISLWYLMLITLAVIEYARYKRIIRRKHEC